jgi:hypothetical protein
MRFYGEKPGGQKKYSFDQQFSRSFSPVRVSGESAVV